MKKTILITENQRKLLILEGVSEKITSELKKNAEFVKNVLKSSLQTIKFNYKILFTFSAGISGIMVPINDYIMGLDPTISEQDKNYILAALVMIFYFENEKVFGELYKKISENGLVDLFKKAKNKTQELLDTFYSFLEGINSGIFKSADIISYTFMIPLLPLFMNLGNLSSEEQSELTKRILMSGLITVGSSALRKTISNLINRLRSKR